MSIFKKLFGKSVKESATPEIKEAGFSPSNKTDFTNFTDLVNQNAALSFEKQQNLSELTGTSSWNIDLNAGILSFGDIELPIEVIGSLSFNDYSWMWGWANSKSGIPENLLDGSLTLKEIGKKKQIQEFTKGHFNVEEGFEHKIGLVASGMLNADAYFCANYGQGTMVLTITSDKIARIDKNRPEKVLTTFPQVISAIELDHKEAFKSYLIDRDFGLNISQNTIKGAINGKLVVAEFDNLNRLTSINGKI